MRLDAIYRRALSWAVEVARTPLVLERHQGLAAYAPWASALMRDEDFPPDDVPTLLERLDCHFGALFVAGEGRHHAARFLRRVAEHLPLHADALGRAADLYQAEAGLIHRICQILGGFDPHDEGIARRLADRGVRREIAALIREARDRDAEAVGLLESAL